MNPTPVYIADSVLDVMAKSDMTDEQFKNALVMLAQASKDETPSDKLVQVQTAIVNSCKNSTKAA